jgi:predicted lipoprotein with Yx(FWY)xxD motif
MKVVICALAVGLALLAGCSEDEAPRAEDPTAPAEQSPGDATESATEPPSPTTSSEPAEHGTRLVASASDFGTMLFDETGQAIYLFDVETTSEPRCYDACAEAWPPVLTKGKPVAGEGLDAALLGTVERTDGSTQVTYGGHPLYFYAHEGKNEVLCHDVFLNGGNWYVVQPDGDAAPPG